MISNWQKHVFKEGEEILCDTNIWLHAFPRQGRSRWTHGNLALIRMMTAGKAVFVIDAFVVSEFVNRFCRMAYEAYCGRCKTDKTLTVYQTYKNFRQSPDFTSVAHDAEVYSKQFMKLPRVKFVDTLFSSMRPVSLIEDFGKGNKDWNDMLLAETCRKFNFKLATNDADFAESGIDILTSNMSLLSKCRITVK